MEQMFKKGFLVRNVNNDITFHSGDEFMNLIFITPGSSQDIESDYDFESGRHITDEVVKPNAVELLSGERMGWGSHMFIQAEEFISWVKNMKFLLNANPYLKEKIKIDLGDDWSIDRFRQLKGMQMANAIILNAKLIHDGLVSGDIDIPRSVIAIYANDVADHYQDEYDRLRDLLYETQDDDEIEKIKKQMEDLNSINVVEQGTEMARSEILEFTKVISDIEPFDIELDVKREIKKHKQKKEEENDTGANDGCNADCEGGDE